ncbi:hypothetical protein ACFL11_00145 [Patescibacteria group bacterium]
MGQIKLGKVLNKVISIIDFIIEFFLKFTGVLIVIVLLTYYAGPKIIDLFEPDVWTLFACKEKSNETECYENSYEVPGFRTKRDCLFEGAARFPEQGFECGKNCENGYDTVSEIVNICEDVCNLAGCRQ